MFSGVFITIAKRLIYPQNLETKEDKLNYQLVALFNIFLIPLIILVALFSLYEILSVKSFLLLVTDKNLYISLIILGAISGIYLLNHTIHYHLARSLFIIITFILVFFTIVFPVTTVTGPNPFLIDIDLLFFNIIIVEFTNIFYSSKYIVCTQLAGLGLFLFFYFFYNPLPGYLDGRDLVIEVAFVLTISVLMATNSGLRNAFYHELQNQNNRLEEAEEQFRTLFINSPVPIWLFDLTYVQEFFNFLQRSGVPNITDYLKSNEENFHRCIKFLKVLDINTATLELFHVKNKNELIAQLPDIFDLYFDIFSQTILKYAQGITEYQLESTVKSERTGENSTYLIKWSVIQGNKQPVLRALAVMFNITERKQYEHTLLTLNNELQRKNELITNIQNNIPVITFRTDHEFIFRELEGSGIKTLDKKEFQYQNRSLFDLFPQAKDFIPKLYNMKPLQFETTGNTDTGETWFYDVYLIPIKLSTTSVTNIEINGFAIKITEEKMIQQRLLESEKLAVLGQMVAGIAHEINNPLAYIKSNTHSFQNFANNAKLLVQELTTLINQHTFVEKEQIQELYAKFDWNFLCEDIDSLIQDNINGQDLIEKVVADLRSYSYQDIYVSETFRPIDINTIILQAVKIMSYKDKTRIDYLVDLVPNVTISGIATKLSQAFLNLFKNSSQAILTTGVIRITSKIVNNDVEIKIWDNGCGIDPIILKNLFRPFTTTKKDGKGMGLGLMIINTIVTDHKGSITIQSKFNAYTEVALRFPLIKGPLK